MIADAETRIYFTRVGANWQSVKSRMMTLGPDGKLLSAITGQESDALLRRLAIQLSNQCPVGVSHGKCPLRMLQGLSNVALDNVVQQLDRQTLLELFEKERECRNSPGAQRQSRQTPK